MQRMSNMSKNSKKLQSQKTTITGSKIEKADAETNVRTEDSSNNNNCICTKQYLHHWNL